MHDLTADLKKLQSNQRNKGGAAALDKFLNDAFVMPGMFQDVHELEELKSMARKYTAFRLLYFI